MGRSGRKGIERGARNAPMTNLTNWFRLGRAAIAWEYSSRAEHGLGIALLPTLSPGLGDDTMKPTRAAVCLALAVLFASVLASTAGAQAASPAFTPPPTPQTQAPEVEKHLKIF